MFGRSLRRSAANDFWPSELFNFEFVTTDVRNSEMFKNPSHFWNQSIYLLDLSESLSLLGLAEQFNISESFTLLE